MGNPEACRRNRSRQAGTRNIPDLPASPGQLRDPMHILFVNPHLTRYQTEAGTWARQLVKDLRAAQTTVTTIPEFSDEDRAVTGPTGGVAGRVKRFVQERLPMNWGGLLIELALFSGPCETPPDALGWHGGSDGSQRQILCMHVHTSMTGRRGWWLGSSSVRWSWRFIRPSTLSDVFGAGVSQD